jgi:hypothetical protein
VFSAYFSNDAQLMLFQGVELFLVAVCGAEWSIVPGALSSIEKSVIIKRNRYLLEITSEQSM